RAVDALGSSGPLAQAIEGYEERSEQLQMAALVERTLADEGVALIEAGTGTGKTLAYLVPAILSGKRVVISTGTKTLQDQIMQHDLPLLSAALGVGFDSAVMKGLSNYLCLRRFEEFQTSPEADKPEFARHLPLLRAFRAESATGERSELGLPEGAPLWSEVHSGSDTRIGQRCPHFEACFVTRMRRRAEAAQIIVVNHHLFFADLALRGPVHGGAAIPDYDAVIFDEAHQIEDVITEFFGVRISSARLETLLRDVERSARASRTLDEVRARVHIVASSASELFASLPRPALSATGGEGGRRPLPDGQLTPPQRERALVLDSALEAVQLSLKASAYESEAQAQAARRVARVREELAIVVDAQRSHVLWTELRGKRSSLGASPVEVAEILRERLFEERKAVIMTSATLSLGEDFAFARQRLGIDFEVSELRLSSPFDYAQKAALYLPTHLPDPRAEEYVERAAEEILSLTELTGGGAFVLCTSLRMMQRLYQACLPKLRTAALLQGMAPKTELLDTFKARGDAVLFASNSFWEGIDVPGAALRLVIIDKLPFEVPTDPLVAARCARMEARGEAPFMGYLVPSAALALKQGFGRLIRTRQDRGIVAILDRRIATKGYGRVLLDSLPDASRCYFPEEVRAFWHS
ncbi:MAG TPA: ATP-dependent DNA helicase, partial [Polyangiales bacterium]